MLCIDIGTVLSIELLQDDKTCGGVHNKISLINFHGVQYLNHVQLINALLLLCVQTYTFSAKSIFNILGIGNGGIKLLFSKVLGRKKR